MTWKADALLHAKEQDPKESCGLLLNIRGKEKYFPCQNLAITSHQCFIMNPEDFVAGDSLGEIIGIVHSHPTTPPVASEADKISCEQSNLPWYIVNPKTETWGEYAPSGYKPDMIGLPWVWGVSDCWSLKYFIFQVLIIDSRLMDTCAWTANKVCVGKSRQVG